MAKAIDDASYLQLIDWGLGHCGAGRHREALAYFRVALGARAEDPLAQKLAAACYQRLGRKRQAAALYRRVLGLRPDDTDVLTNLGEILIAQMRYQEALALLEKALRLDPKYENPHSQRARALIMQVVDNLGTR